MPGVPFVPFAGEYAGQDATGLADKLAALRQTRDGSGNPVLGQTVKHLSFEDCGRALQAILDTPRIRARNVAAAKATGVSLEELQAQQEEKRAVEGEAAAQVQVSAQAAACRGLLGTAVAAAGDSASTAADAVDGRGRHGNPAPLAEDDAEARLKSIPAASRRAAVADLAARARRSATVKEFNALAGWGEKLEVVTIFLGKARAAGMSPKEYGAQQAAERGDPPPEDDSGCVCA